MVAYDQYLDLSLPIATYHIVPCETGRQIGFGSVDDKGKPNDIRWK